MNAYELFWGKANRDNQELALKPLWTHLVDTAVVFVLLWENFVPKGIRMKLSSGFLNEKEAQLYFAFWAGVHDIGKATPTFQGKILEHKLNLENSFGLRFNVTNSSPHGYLSYVLLKNWIEKNNFHETTINLARLVSIHHGKVPFFAELHENLDPGGKLWQQNQQELIDFFADAWGNYWQLGLRKCLFRPVTNQPLIVLLAGMTTLADWIASMTDFFSSDGEQVEFNDYVEKIKEKARKVAESAGFFTSAGLDFKLFGDVFPGMVPSDLQVKVADMTDSVEPTLTIIEAPTGEGKTEAALFLASKQMAGKYDSGLYVAMPTMATSNAMVERLISFLGKTHDSHKAGKVINFRLIHGKALLQPEQQDLFDNWLKIRDVGVSDNSESITATASWLISNKRSLLAPYGLGTVDQAMSSALRIKHFFLKLLGLAGKTIIIDEVHAYDVYMQHILHRMLQWLKAIDCHVILLSATLPTSFRNAFLKSWGCVVKEKSDYEIPNYPAILKITNGELQKEDGFSTRMRNTINLFRISSNPQLIAVKALELANSGATIAVICNTVRRAQAIYQKIEELNINEIELTLFHAGFMHKHRVEIENYVKRRFGNKRKPKEPAILVATQVVEQSLDLDFDVMISDLAPVDLLLQRAGRVHRHKSIERPECCEKLLFYWACDDTKPGELPSFRDIGIFGTQNDIYDTFTLYKTYCLLISSKTWNLPEDYRFIIDTVYPQADLRKQAEELKNVFKNSNDKIDNAVDKLEKSLANARNEFRKHSLPSPENWEQIFDGNIYLNDPEDSFDNTNNSALTRMGLMSLEVSVIFCGDDNQLYFDEKGLDAFDPRLIKDKAVLTKLLQNSLRTSNPRVISEILEMKKSNGYPYNISGMNIHNIMIVPTEEHSSKIRHSFYYMQKLGVLVDNI